MNSLNPSDPEFDFAGETEYLITDVEELVNDTVGNYLENETFRIDAKLYRPEMSNTTDKPQLPIGINRIARLVDEKVAQGPREFVGIDLLFDFPVAKSTDQNPLNVALVWSDGVRARLAIVDKRPIFLIDRGENDDETIYAAEISKDVMRTYLESIGLPPTFWGDDFRSLMADINMCPDIKIKRQSDHLVDLGTTLNILYDARFMTNDDDEKEVVQELCLSLDHKDGTSFGGFLYPDKAFRNMMRFERSKDGNAWKYRGTYAGKLETGELIDTDVQVDPRLVVPSAKLLQKAFTFLNERDR